MNKILTLTLAILMLLSLSACGGGNTTTPDEPPATNSPAPTPEQNDPVTPPNNSGGDDGTPDGGDGNDENLPKEITQPIYYNIPYELTPEVLRKVVGVIGDNELIQGVLHDEMGINQEGNFIYIAFERVTSSEFEDLMNHYRATATKEESIEVNLEIGWARRGSMGSSGTLFEYSWGRIFVNYADSVFNSSDSEKIEIGAEFY